MSAQVSISARGDAVPTADRLARGSTDATIYPTGDVMVRIETGFNGSGYLRRLAALATELADQIEANEAEMAADLAEAWLIAESVRAENERNR